ncbi:MAG TPA: anti-sigma factor [Bryocella sp.]|nr:anti-sigma factor [Bryocella sp.]
MSTHEQFADDLALYALEELTGAERVAFEEHLQTCAACRRELQVLRSDLGLLGLSSSGPQPPARSKERLMRAIAAEPRVSRQEPAAVPRRSRWWSLAPALAALGLLVFALTLWRGNRTLRDQLTELRIHSQDLSAQLDQANDELRLLTSPDAVHVSLNQQKSGKEPGATAIFSPTRRRMILMASNLPAPPAGKAYELWIIPAGGAPIPSGVFKPDEHGNAVMMDHPMPEGVAAKTFAITVEDEAGSDKPTSAPVLVGSVG